MSSDSDDSLGFGFYAKLAGLILVIGIGVFIAFVIFSRAIVAWASVSSSSVIPISSTAPRAARLPADPPGRAAPKC